MTPHCPCQVPAIANCSSSSGRSSQLDHNQLSAVLLVPATRPFSFDPMLYGNEDRKKLIRARSQAVTAGPTGEPQLPQLAIRRLFFFAPDYCSYSMIQARGSTKSYFHRVGALIFHSEGSAANLVLIPPGNTPDRLAGALLATPPQCCGSAPANFTTTTPAIGASWLISSSEIWHPHLFALLIRSAS
jgi:hypothetical protein